MRGVGIPIPVVVAGSQRVPDPDLVGREEVAAAVEAVAGDGVELEAGAVHVGEGNAERVEVGLRHRLVQIPHDIRGFNPFREPYCRTVGRSCGFLL